MIPTADADPIALPDVHILLRRAHLHEATHPTDAATVRRLIWRVRRGEGSAMERLARMVEP